MPHRISHAAAFAAEQVRILKDESLPALLAAKPYATLNHRALPDVLAVNELVKVWWEAVVVVPAWKDVPYAQKMAMEERFLEHLAKKEGFTPQLLDYAIMTAFFAGFAEAGAALPLARAEPIRGFPTAEGTAGEIISFERLSGVNVAPFLRGRVFQALTKQGMIAKADLLTLMSLVDELEASGEHGSAPHAVNIEPASLLHADDFELLAEQLHRLPAHIAPRLCVEVTERGRDNPRLKTIFQNLALLKQATGCLVAYDDYHGGDWEDEQLLILQPDSVKLDGVIIKPLIVETRDDKEAFEAGMAKVHGMIARIAEAAPDAKIVAEWTETPEAYQAMASLGVDGVQSYVLEARAKVDPSILHLPPEILAQRELALGYLGDKRASAKQTLKQRLDAINVMAQVQEMNLRAVG